MRTNKQLVSQFNSTIKELTNIILSHTKDNNEISIIKSLERKISLAKTIGSDDIIIQHAYPLFIDKYADIIVSEDESMKEKFFYEIDAMKEIKSAKNSSGIEDEFIAEIIDLIRSKFRLFSTETKKDIYRKLNLMLELCIEYKLGISKQ